MAKQTLLSKIVELVILINISRFQAFHSTAKCVAALMLQAHNNARPLAAELLQEIQKKRTDTQTVFCLLTIGEIGRFL